MSVSALPTGATSAGNSQQADTSFYTLILGVTDEGRKFRPSDWADRLFGACGVYAHDDGIATEIGDHVCLTERDGRKGLVYSSKLRDIEPQLFHFLEKFAKSNRLRTSRLSQNQWNRNSRRVVVLPKRNFT